MENRFGTDFSQVRIHTDGRQWARAFIRANIATPEEAHHKGIYYWRTVDRQHAQNVRQRAIA